jgi:hypothetical protein
MTYTHTTWFQHLCRTVLFLFTLATFHPASLRVPWTLYFAHWTFDFGLTSAYGKGQDPLPVTTPGTPSSKAAKPNQSGPSGPMIRLPGHVLPALAQAKAVLSQSKIAADEPLTLTLVLRRADQSGFERYLRDVYNPSSTNYRRFLTQSELSDRFGPSRDAYDGVLSYLQDHGFTLVKGSANRLTLTVRGTRAQAERTFAIHIGDYKIGDTTFYANDSNPQLPMALASRVRAVSGLSNLAKPHRVTQENVGKICDIGNVVDALVFAASWYTRGGGTACSRWIDPNVSP